MIQDIFFGEKQPDEVLAGCINIYENVLPNPKEIIDIVENQVSSEDPNIFWERAETVQEGIDQSARTNQLLRLSYLASITGNEGLRFVHNQMAFIFNSALISYINRYLPGDNLFSEPLGMLKYSGGQEYIAHFDGGSQTKRTVSGILYLNDDYEGGEIWFPHHSIKIKPQAGMLMLFPSNYAYSHAALPVTEGTKYAIVTWMKDGI